MEQHMVVFDSAELSLVEIRQVVSVRGEETTVNLPSSKNTCKKCIRGS